MFTRIPVKQEQFLLLVLDGQPASRAYAQIYGQDKSKAVCEASGSRLLSSAKVQARKGELMAARHARQPVSREYLTGELLAVINESRALKQQSAAIAGLQTIAKLHGLIVDRQELLAIVRKPSESPESPDQMSELEWAKQFSPNTVIEHIQPTDTLLTKEDEPVQSSATTDVVEDSIDE